MAHFAVKNRRQQRAPLRSHMLLRRTAGIISRTTASLRRHLGVSTLKKKSSHKEGNDSPGITDARVMIRGAVGAGDTQRLFALIDEGVAAGNLAPVMVAFNILNLWSSPNEIQQDIRKEVASRLAAVFKIDSARCDPQEAVLLLSALRNSDLRSRRDAALVAAVGAFILRSLAVPPTADFSAYAPTLTAREAAMAMCGLRRMRSESDEALVLVRATCVLITMARGPLDAQGAGMLLSGLQGMSSAHAEVRTLVAEVRRLLLDCDQLNPRSLTMAMLSLRRLSSDAPEVIALVSVIADKAGSFTDKLSADQAVAVVNGLRGMSSQHVAVRTLLTTLTPLLNSATPASLDTKAAAMLVDGLRFLRGEDAEVRMLLRPVTRLLAASGERDHLNQQGVALVVGGLRGLCADIPEVEPLIEQVIRLVRGSPDLTISSRDGIMMVSGMSRLGRGRVATELLGEVTRLLRTCSLPIQGPTMCSLLHALHERYSDDPGVPELLVVVCNMVASSLTRDTSVNVRGAAMCVFGMQGMSDNCPEVLVALILVARLVRLAGEGGGEVSAKSASLMLYGLRSLSATTPESLLLAELVAGLAGRCKERLNSQETAMAVAGLQRMSGGGGQLLRLVAVTRALVASCEETFSPRTASTMLYGLRRLSSSVPEVVMLFREVRLQLERVDTKTFAPSVPEAAMLVNGLQGMSSDNPEVEKIAGVVACLVSQVSGSCTAQEAVMLITGLRRLEGEASEVRSLVNEVVRLADTCSQPLSAAETCIVVDAVRLHSASRALLSLALRLVRSCCEPDALSPLDVQMAQHGLELLRMSDVPEAIALVEAVSRLRILDPHRILS